MQLHEAARATRRGPRRCRLGVRKHARYVASTSRPRYACAALPNSCSCGAPESDAVYGGPAVGRAGAVKSTPEPVKLTTPGSSSTRGRRMQPPLLRLVKAARNWEGRTQLSAAVGQPSALISGPIRRSVSVRRHQLSAAVGDRARPAREPARQPADSRPLRTTPRGWDPSRLRLKCRAMREPLRGRRLYSR